MPYGIGNFSVEVVSSDVKSAVREISFMSNESISFEKIIFKNHFSEGLEYKINIDEVDSSNTNNRGFRTIALAKEISCFYPVDNIPHLHLLLCHSPFL